VSLAVTGAASAQTAFQADVKGAGSRQGRGLVLRGWPQLGWHSHRRARHGEHRYADGLPHGGPGNLSIFHRSAQSSDHAAMGARSCR
jgi:hypothetical protein